MTGDRAEAPLTPIFDAASAIGLSDQAGANYPEPDATRTHLHVATALLGLENEVVTRMSRIQLTTPDQADTSVEALLKQAWGRS